MSKLGLRLQVGDILEANGFAVLLSPFTIGAIEFTEDRVYLGPQGTLSILLVVDQPTSREEESRLYWLGQRLARALDADASRRSVSIVIVGGSISDRLLGDLQAIARVLIVDESLPVGRVLSPLLQLKSIQTSIRVSDGVAQLEQGFRGQRDWDVYSAMIDASARGERSVQQQLVKWIEAALATNEQRGDV